MEYSEKAAKQIFEIVAGQDAQFPPPTNLRGAISRSLIILVRSLTQARKLEIITDEEYQRARKGYVDDYLMFRSIPKNATPQTYTEISPITGRSLESLTRLVERQQTDG